jgi:hypothetical protein
VLLSFLFDQKGPKNQGFIQILRFCYPFRRARTQTRPACGGAQTWVLTTASNGENRDLNKADPTCSRVLLICGNEDASI